MSTVGPGDGRARAGTAAPATARAIPAVRASARIQYRATPPSIRPPPGGDERLEGVRRQVVVGLNCGLAWGSGGLAGARELLAAAGERIRELDQLEQVDDVHGEAQGDEADGRREQGRPEMPVTPFAKRDEARGERRERERPAPGVH